MKISRKAACIAIFCAFALTAGAQKSAAGVDSVNLQQTQMATAIKSMSPLGSWQGSTPCADCSGIDTTLTMYGRNADTDSGIYKMSMTYIGRNTTNVIYGRWVLLRGTPSNSNGYIYRLDPNRSGGQFYLHADDSSLQLLDGHLNVTTIAGQGVTLKPVAP